MRSYSGINQPEYRRFIESGIDTRPLGLELGGMRADERYFCTPKKADVFGRVGVDGIHFCFVKGYGDMVFCVSPMDVPPRFVRPVARDFTDFLRLLAACGGTSVIESAWRYDAERFREECEVEKSGGDTEKAIRSLHEKLGVTPMEDAYAYIRGTQTDFDFSAFDIPDEDEKPYVWNVWFGKGIYAQNERGREGIEKKLDRRFEWCGGEWSVPSLYICPKGIIVDILHVVPKKAYDEFYEKYCFLLDCGEDVPESLRRRAVNENPLNLDFSVELIVNGKRMKSQGGSSFSYGGEGSAGDARIADAIIQHYCETLSPDSQPEAQPVGSRADTHSAGQHGIAPDTGAVLRLNSRSDAKFDAKQNSADNVRRGGQGGSDIEPAFALYRVSFACRYKEGARIALHLSPDKRMVTEIPLTGKETRFEYPEGEAHTLTIKRELCEKTGVRHAHGVILPQNYTVISYEIEPDISPENACVRDWSSNGGSYYEKARKTKETVDVTALPRAEDAIIDGVARVSDGIAQVGTASAEKITEVIVDARENAPVGAADGTRENASAEADNEAASREIGSAAIGIIGGADGPTAILVGKRNELCNERSAVSGLSFDENERPDWHLELYAKPDADLYLDLVDPSK